MLALFSHVLPMCTKASWICTERLVHKFRKRCTSESLRMASNEWIKDVKSRNCLKNSCKWAERDDFIARILKIFNISPHHSLAAIFIRTNMTMRCLLLNSGRFRSFLLTLFGGKHGVLFVQSQSRVYVSANLVLYVLENRHTVACSLRLAYQIFEILEVCRCVKFIYIGDFEINFF